jgi:hypothetical protein
VIFQCMGGGGGGLEGVGKATQVASKESRVE